MRKVTILTAALLMLAGCGGSGDDAVRSASPEAAAAPTTTASAAPATTLAPAEQMEATVVFNGDGCSYVGPAVVPDGTTVVFEFEATAKPDAIAMVVGGVAPGTTWEEFVDWAANTPAGGPPPFSAGGYRVLYGPGSLDMILFEKDYMVACATSPSDTSENFAAAFIEVSEA